MYIYIYTYICICIYVYIHNQVKNFVLAGIFKISGQKTGEGLQLMIWIFKLVSLLLVSLLFICLFLCFWIKI